VKDEQANDPLLRKWCFMISFYNRDTQKVVSWLEVLHDTVKNA